MKYWLDMLYLWRHNHPAALVFGCKAWHTAYCDSYWSCLWRHPHKLYLRQVYLVPGTFASEGEAVDGAKAFIDARLT